jgi:hypothetical protein
MEVQRTVSMVKRFFHHSMNWLALSVLCWIEKTPSDREFPDNQDMSATAVDSGTK